MATTMTSWDLFEDLRAAQDELLRATRGHGWRPIRVAQTTMEQAAQAGNRSRSPALLAAMTRPGRP